ncbi:helix-turn-helix transcriptional regulator [Aureimonas pseudogalii]|uniref:AraC-like DNA-binding protein n=1 Tax=Aureimonas pseudogalii TaxID=1744844 RepID=A0A7W6MKU5_9HYPH|nr:AraC family transcriptional regulator [Aureimonas pseudogalii]MBB3999268.1 AraC-like DNA-binding protein [Aureimonas pseudogalii]
MGNSMLDRLVARGPFRQTLSFPRRHDGFHIMATSAGHELASGPGYDWNGRTRGHTPFSILQHTISGAGRLRYERRDFRISAGETMLVSIPHSHRYWLEAGESWRFFWIAMSGQEALRLHRAILAASGPVFRLSDQTADILAGICLQLCRPDTSAGQASSEAYRATMALHDDLMARIDTGTGSAVAHRAIDRAAAHARAHLDAPLDVASLAAVAGLSRAHFVRLFTRFQGVSPSEFVLRERMGRATRLLVNGQLSIKDIADICGFDDPNYFAKVFRRTYAISPSEFRTTGMYSAAAQPSPPPAT